MCKGFYVIFGDILWKQKAEQYLKEYYKLLDYLFLYDILIDTVWKWRKYKQ